MDGWCCECISSTTAQASFILTIILRSRRNRAASSQLPQRFHLHNGHVYHDSGTQPAHDVPLAGSVASFATPMVIFCQSAAKTRIQGRTACPMRDRSPQMGHS
jgi:hypothetical protein